LPATKSLAGGGAKGGLGRFGGGIGKTWFQFDALGLLFETAVATPGRGSTTFGGGGGSTTGKMPDRKQTTRYTI
jgi:hypothetical protein